MSSAGIELIKKPNIFLLKLERAEFLHLHKPCSELKIDKVIYYPKSFILKKKDPKNPKYLTCYLENDNKTWAVLDEKGKYLGNLKKGMFKYGVEMCAIFYENTN